MRWLILTGELPPHCGGVGEYTAQLGAALGAAGDRVAVCVPGSGSAPSVHGVEVVRLPDRFGPRARREMDERLDAEPSEVLVQYVPNVMGLRGANLPLCRWLRRRARARGDSVRVMVHEPYFYLGWARPHRNALALAQRLMMRTLLQAAGEILISTDAWRGYLLPYLPARAPSPIALPVPSAVPRCDLDPVTIRRRREAFARGDPLVGHFGTYGHHIAPMLRDRLVRLMEAEASVHAVCAGDGSSTFVERLGAACPHLAPRLHASGRLPSADVAATLACCDVLVQPYPDGVTTRRTSLMAGLINARPVVTTSGALTEPIWTSTRGVALAPVHAADTFVDLVRHLLHDDHAALELGARGEAAYRAHFALAHSVARLRHDAAGAAA